MSSFLSKFKGSSGNATTANGHAATKKDPNAPQLSPLEKLLADAGPNRDDGSDKLFGMENCLYHSPPFREHILNFPNRSQLSAPHATNLDSTPIETNGAETSPVNTNGLGIMAPLSPLRLKINNASPASPVKKSNTPVVVPPPPPGKEENKDSSEYKKKLALATGPILQMDQASGSRYDMPESMFTSLKDIFENIIEHESRIGVVSPRRGTDLVRSLNSVFSVPMHQDAHECLNFVLNEIVEDMEKYAKQMSKQNSESGSHARSDGSSIDSLHQVIPNTKWVHELFEGTLTSETKCLTCQNTSAREEAYLDLSVDLGLFSSVTSCLLKFSEEEMLNERNKFHCDSCNGLQEAEKRMKIKRLPKILALHLKRFTYTEDLQRLQKLHHRVAYPYYLRLFNLTDDAEDQDKLYELYAVVVHIGMSPYQGHYVSIIKTQEWGWLLFDDENVEPVEKGFVRQYFGSEQGLACAYVLFYQETTFEAAEKDMDEEDRMAISQPFTMGSKEPGLQPNGKANGPYVNANGSFSPPSPTHEETEFPSLDRSFTAPLSPSAAPPNGAPPFSNALEHVTSSPILPFLNRKKSTVLKKAVDQEADAKAHEKDLPKLPKEKKREPNMLHRWQSKRDVLKEDVAPSPVVSRTSISEGGSRNSQTQEEMPATLQLPAAQESVVTPVQEDTTPTPLAEPHKDSATNGFFSSSMNRFKTKSMKGKPKLWGSTKSKGELSHNPPSVQPVAEAPEQPSLIIPPIPHIMSPPSDSQYSLASSPSLPSIPSMSQHEPAEPPNLPPLPPTPGLPPPMFHAIPTPIDTPQNHTPQNHTPGRQTPDHQIPNHNRSLTPDTRETMARTPTPTALPPIEQQSGRKKEKRGFFGLGRKKSVAGI
ncbi:cysteine proteinase [Microthyrium microscopicum]|uniref:ubiquitinyl hydrolase 1 n=1 Tax=Microthyrium microscopicum TaxID=703497 RepID=A0A6A6UUA9_9PEZI|nr:cysteine proteinase [Microthyrium microscopicum]